MKSHEEFWIEQLQRPSQKVHKKKTQTIHKTKRTPAGANVRCRNAFRLSRRTQDRIGGNSTPTRKILQFQSQHSFENTGLVRKLLERSLHQTPRPTSQTEDTRAPNELFRPRVIQYQIPQPIEYDYYDTEIKISLRPCDPFPLGKSNSSLSALPSRRCPVHLSSTALAPLPLPLALDLIPRPPFNPYPPSSLHQHPPSSCPFRTRAPAPPSQRLPSPPLRSAASSGSDHLQQTPAECCPLR